MHGSPGPGVVPPNPEASAEFGAPLLADGARARGGGAFTVVVLQPAPGDAAGLTGWTLEG